MEPKVAGALVLPHQTAQQQRLQHLAQIKSTVCYCSECGNQLKFRSFSVHPCFTRAVSQHGKYRARQLVKRLNQRPEAEQSRHVSHSVPSLAPPPVQHVHVTSCKSPTHRLLHRGFLQPSFLRLMTQRNRKDVAAILLPLLATKRVATRRLSQPHLPPL